MSRERVAICASKLVDSESGRVHSPQRWLYAQELSKLLTELGYAVVWYQIGSGARFEIIPEVPLIAALPGDSRLGLWPAASNEFWEKTGEAAGAIYFDLALAYPQVHERSIAIAHGIEWNDPLWETSFGGESERDEWKRRLWMAFYGPRKVVAVDSGVIHWASATWPGLYHRFVHIPNFVPPPTPFEDRSPAAGGTNSQGSGSVDSMDRRPTRNEDDQPLSGFNADRSSSLRLVFWDTLAPRSGIAETLEAMQEMLDEDERVELVIAGRGSADAEQYVTHWAQAQRRVTCCFGALDGALLRDAVLLMPGKWGVGPSFLCLAGMAAGSVPVVGHSSGLTDYVIHDHNGLVIQPTPQGIREAVDELIRDPGRRTRMSANARKMAEAFSLRVWRRRWRRLIEEEFGGRG